MHEHPVHLVLHGHGHKTQLETMSYKNCFDIPVVGAASCSSVSQTKQYCAEFLLFDVTRKDESWEISMQNFQLELANKQFNSVMQKSFHMPVSF